jgi:hypothetical protein
VFASASILGLLAVAFSLGISISARPPRPAAQTT